MDAYGSVLTHYFQTGVYDKSQIRPYKVEGLGKNIIPDNLNIDVIDEFIQVDDRESALRARELAKKEGLMVGYSSGSAMQAVFQLKERFKPGDVVVALFPDHGSRYLGKVFNDEWMRQQGFLENEPEATTTPPPKPTNPAPLPILLSSSDTPGEAIPYPYSYEAIKKRYRTYYRTYRIKYKKYLRQTKDSLRILGE